MKKSLGFVILIAVCCAGCAPALKDLKPALSAADSGGIWFASAGSLVRSPDGSLRVRAHEALCAFAGRNLPFRPNGTPEQIEEDARGIEAALSAPAR